LSLELDGGDERLHLSTSLIFTKYVESPDFDTIPYLIMSRALLDMDSKLMDCTSPESPVPTPVTEPLAIPRGPEGTGREPSTREVPFPRVEGR